MKIGNVIRIVFEFCKNWCDRAKRKLKAIWHRSWLVAVALIILSFGLYFYFSHFNDGFSNDTSKWADFATFNGFFLGLVNLVVLGYISYVTYNATITFNRLQIRPLLFITIDKPERFPGLFKDSWYVVNCAKNSALNLLVRYCTSRTDESTYTKWISCTSLIENQRLELFWVQYADQIEICFSDLTHEKYYKFEFKDYLGQTREIDACEYNRYLNESAINNRGNNLLKLRDELESFVTNARASGRDPVSGYIKDFIHTRLRVNR